MRRIRALAGERLDWAWVLAVARPHGILPLLHHHLCAADGAVPAVVLDSLRRRAEADAQRNLRLAGELLRLLDRFAAHDVSVVPYKGPVLAMRCYGDLALRPFRDLDFLVHQQDFACAERVLVAEGFRSPLGRTPREEALTRADTGQGAFWRDGDIVELHWAFLPREFPLPLDLGELWARLEPVPLGARSVLTLCDEHLLLVLCAHGARHRWERLEWICDLAELLRRAPDLDLPRALERARTLGAERMVLLGLRLVTDLLDVPLPDGVRERVATDSAVAALARLVRNGLFRHTPGTMHERWELRLFQLRTRERWRDRARFAARVAFQPTLGDLTWLPLPDVLYPLYYVARPVRLIAKYGLGRRGTESEVPHAAPSQKELS